MKKHIWLIRGYDGSRCIFEAKAGFGQFTEERIQRLLQGLAAKAGLSFSEMVGAYAKPKTRISNSLLTVHKEFRRPTYACGSNPFFTASVVDENGTIPVSALPS